MFLFRCSPHVCFEPFSMNYYTNASSLCVTLVWYLAVIFVWLHPCLWEGLHKYASPCTEQVKSSHVKLSKYLCPFKSSWASMTYIKLSLNIQYLAANVDCKTVTLSWVHWGRIQWCVVNSINGNNIIHVYCTIGLHHLLLTKWSLLFLLIINNHLCFVLVQEPGKILSHNIYLMNFLIIYATKCYRDPIQISQLCKRSMTLSKESNAELTIRWFLGQICLSLHIVTAPHDDLNDLKSP